MHTVGEALKLINKAVDRGSPSNTLKALQNAEACLPFPFLESQDYQSALAKQKEQNIPSNVLVSDW